MRQDGDLLDVLVVGGGPVGLAAAIEARMRGLTVTVVEPREGSVDKACGEGLMPGAVTALARLGVTPGGHALRGIRYLSAHRQVEHRFEGAAGHGSGTGSAALEGTGLGVRRTVLHSALADRAMELGVRFVTAKVTALEQDADGVVAAGIRARYLIGADGLHSTVRSLLDLERAPSSHRRYGIRQHFRIQPWSDLVEVHWTDTVEAYVTPVDDCTVGVALLGRQGMDYAARLAGIPALASRLAGIEPASKLRGAGPFRQRASRRRVGRVMLVGDSSGYVDAITGEGIRVGLAQAEAAVTCIAADDVAGYERAWAQRTRDFRLLTTGLVALAGSPLRPVIVPLATALPGVFGAIVERLAR
ncbi:MAG: NAD(P)/FAD-dependent oxidoreductase [Lacisediminihabitans sp.]